MLVSKIGLSSGREFYPPDLEILAMLARTKCIEWLGHPRPLRHGEKSRLYIYNRERLSVAEVLLGAIGMKLYTTAENILRDSTKKDRDNRQLCFIGVPDAGKPLAKAAQTSSLKPRIRRPNRPEAMSLDMKKARFSGERWVKEQSEPERYKYVLVEDALTTGGSLLTTRQRLAEDGFPIEDMYYLVFIDRQQGGLERLRREGVCARPIYQILDILEVFLELELWPEDHCRAAREEIISNQFL